MQVTARNATARAAARPPLVGRQLSLLSPASQPHHLYNASKRTLDVVLGLAFLTLATPVVVAAAIAVAVTTRSNPLFLQQRVGVCGRPFTLIKLKTMRNGSDAFVPRELDETNGPTFKSRSDPRITRTGGLIRKASIDELPQLLNVVFGQMSLVGPRPPLAEEVVHYTHPQLERLTVKPGLTGIWQVSGRSNIPFHTWMALDRVYVRKRSLWLDIMLLVRTPWAVLSMRGAY